MKFWQKKRFIPKHTSFCYRFLNHNNSKRCKWLRKLGVKTFIYNENGQEIIEKVRIIHCSICHQSNLDDILLDEKIKICGLYHENYIYIGNINCNKKNYIKKHNRKIMKINAIKKMG